MSTENDGTNPNIQTTDVSSNIQTLVDQFPGILSDFKKNYISSKMYPKDQDKQNFFTASKNQVISSTASIFAINNDIQTKIDGLYANALDLDVKIQKEKETNGVLKQLLSQVEGGIGGAAIMIKDYKIQYARQYITNCAMLIGIFVVGYMMKKVYTK